MVADDRVPEAAAVGFDREAASYAGVRPTYAPAAIDLVHAATPAGGVVCDVAAGTGIFTRQLMAAGLDVTAVEPVAGMRRQFHLDTPAGHVVDGTAEALPFGDASFDVVTVAQAFHWFDAPAALAEIHRVLRPGGRLFMIWNERDHSETWIREWTHVVDSLALGEGVRPYHRHQDTDWSAVVADAGGFTPVESHVYDNPQTGTPAGLVERARSMSYVASLDPDHQATVLDAVRELVATHPDLAGLESFPFPYRTHVHATRRSD
ncbi:MAG: class I SAM-dependent methyltransferase [Acidimicrobiales bacterium]